MKDFPRLTYCGNVHSAVDLDGWVDGVARFAAPLLARARDLGRAFGLGVHWPASLARTLAGDQAALRRAREAMEDLGLALWTANAFPYGDFCADAVKLLVYEPDWETEERLAYTVDCARVCAELASPGQEIPISTLPLGFRPPGARADLRLMARNLARAASAMAAIEHRTGVTCVLALEPEPFCLLETCSEAASFLEQWLFDEGAWTTIPEGVLRRHLGICIDLCHLAVVREDPKRAFSDLAARGIRVPKIQVSACLELRDGAAIDELLSFDEPRYLHQTVAENGLCALDLPEVRDRRAEFTAAGGLRTHFHVPISEEGGERLGTTSRDVARFLRGARSLARPIPLLEVETYTWPSWLARRGAERRLTAADIGGELEFAERCLRG
ncbi:MAG: metabolite traffic protein EboE [Planctomycetota bacterium]